MVTVELDFGERIPSIKEALKEIERRYEPESGRGRTFAILDAYGESTAASLASFALAYKDDPLNPTITQALKDYVRFWCAKQSLVVLMN